MSDTRTMNRDLRQRMIDATRTDSALSIEEQEVTMAVGKRDDRATVFSEIRTVTKQLLAHDEFTIEWIRQEGGGETHRIAREDIADEFDGRRGLVAMKGTIPVSVLLLAKGKPRSTGGLSQTISPPMGHGFDLSVGDSDD